MANPSSVIDFFLHPKFGFITSSTSSPSTITNPLTGFNTLAASVGLSSSFGITWAVNTPPPAAGWDNGIIRDWEDRLFQLVVFHTLASGQTVATQQFETHADSGILFWENQLPTSVQIEIFPNFSIDFSWLIGT